jgi:hypothetical protein
MAAHMKDQDAAGIERKIETTWPGLTVLQRSLGRAKRGFRDLGGYSFRAAMTIFAVGCPRRMAPRWTPNTFGNFVEWA